MPSRRNALGRLAGRLRQRCSLHGNNIVGALGALATASTGDDADAASSADEDECDV